MFHAHTSPHLPLTFNFLFLDFVPAEDSEDANENDDIANPTEKLKTAVHSFLQKSANLVNILKILYCH